MKTRIGFAVAAALALVAAGPAALAAPLTTSANGKKAMAFLDMAFNQHKVKEAFDTYAGPTYRQHNPNVPDGKAAAIKILGGYVASGKGPRYEFKRVIASGDYVVLHSHLASPAGGPGQAAVDIFRFDHGKVVEHWDVLQPVPEKAANANTMF